jgi:subtilisin
MPDRYGIDGYFLASFSNFGYAVTGAGAGVGIISTVPERFGYASPYAVMDGTSMASPAACGALAGQLSERSDYLSMPRDITRAQKARAIFRESAKDIGLDHKYQGRGAPQAK